MQHLVKTTIEELSHWIEKPTSEDENFNQIIQKIQTLFCENKLKTIFRQYEYLDTWYSRNFIYQSLINNTLIFREKIAENGYYIIKMADKTANKYKNNPPVIAFDLYLYWIANVFIMNQIEKTKELVQIVNFHLDTNLLKGGVDYKPVAWFILKLLNDCFGLEVDYSKYHIPKNMGIYEEVLLHKNSSDVDLVQELISQMAQYHILQSEPKNQSDMMSLQFCKAHEYIYAYEILVWLQYRHINGLSNPKVFSHSLMNLPHNQLPNNYPNIRFDDDIFNKIMNIYNLE
ncbi:hypothetical protein [Capnocytophaga canimorsus]|uniref:hypothetical protein n=1 Tax=Capnocytophaga canimorsus TaxID=28188 RepID=UPI000BB1B9B6|nr:hypothetical protein [Capnocytophaga canimorsus]ATA77131.1 hypothetical protein CGC47_05805 [Capnocytophaga canimorsus]PJI83726.1 hypothetical protein CLV61_0332 [Capnocytophaga canimorsus]STA72349.1 Uncharacterised protein [Capnocytophaga canimorsus]